MCALNYQSYFQILLQINFFSTLIPYFLMPIITLCKVVSFKICQQLLFFFQILFKINQIKFLHCELRVETLGRLLLRVHHDEMCFVVQQYCHSPRFELKRENRFQIAMKAFIMVVQVFEFSSGGYKIKKIFA